jgi:hypothetical protein
MKVNLKICDRCGESRVIWKNVLEEDGRMRYCKNCWSAQKPPSSKPTATPIRSRSPKRQKQEQQYSKQRTPYLEEHPFCMATIPGVCTHNSTEVHHKDGRQEDKLTDEDGWMSSCRGCHVWIHSNPEDARELGLLI